MAHPPVSSSRLPNIGADAAGNNPCRAWQHTPGIAANDLKSL